MKPELNEAIKSLLPLEELTDDALIELVKERKQVVRIRQQEVTAVENVLAERKQLRQEQHANLTLENAPYFLPFIEHGRTSCNDENVSNAYIDNGDLPRCTRCYIIESIRFKSWGTRIKIRISLDTQ